MIGERAKRIRPEFPVSRSGKIFRRGLRRRFQAPKRSGGFRRLDGSGFTLIELLIVLVILSLLAALAGPTLVERLKPAKRTVAQAQIEEFSSALENFYIDVSRYPTTDEGLQVLWEKTQNAKGWKGPYLKKNPPSDPWGNPYTYRSPGRYGGYEIVAYGADGKEGGEGENADVDSWENTSGHATPNPQ